MPTSLVVLLAALLVAPACGGDGREETTRTTSPEGPFAVGTRTVTFVDEDRPTASIATAPEKPTRTVVTNLWYPAEGVPSQADIPEARAVEGTFPLVVFSHGQSGEPEQYAPVLHLWAEAGYVVAAPRHPLTIRGLEGGPYSGDYLNQPDDVAFVITSMGERFEDVVDLDHVAVAGHSSGAITARGVAFNGCCHDDRVDAVVLEGILDLPLSGEWESDLRGTPLLLLHGDADGRYADARKLFEEAEAPKFLVTIKGGGHSDPYRAGPPDHRLVAEASIAFLDRYLREEKGALDRLRQVVSGFDFATMEAVPAS